MAAAVNTRYVSVSSSTPTTRNNERISQLNSIQSILFLSLSFSKFLIFIKDLHQSGIKKESMTSITPNGVPVKFADNLFSVVCNRLNLSNTKKNLTSVVHYRLSKIKSVNYLIYQKSNTLNIQKKIQFEQ